MLGVLRAVQEAGRLRNVNIEIVLTSDYESAGAPLDVARTDRIAAGKRTDFALDFEELIL